MYGCNINGHIGTGRTQAQAEIAAGYAILNGLDKADIDDAIPGWDEAVKEQFAPKRPINYPRLFHSMHMRYLGLKGGGGVD